MIEWNKERGFFMYQILVCDDDHDIVSALEIYLTGEGYGVTGAYSGQEAIDLFQQNQFHLVLMDIMMPGMDGIAATAELRKLSNVPPRVRTRTKSWG